MQRWEQFQGVYIHTPFCLHKCLYCDFPSYAGFSEELKNRYVDALCAEIEVRSQQKSLPVAEAATIYFGGGTPTVLNAAQIARIVACLKQYGWWKNPAEATIEANPGTVDAEKLYELRRLGFDRISLGVQSLQDNELRALGRIHTAGQAVQALREAAQAGFQRINADLMSGIPCQTVESFSQTLNTILQFNLLSHVSVYGLILEEGTALKRMVASGKVLLPDEESSYFMYKMTTEILPKAGLQRYEISNYAVPGQESLHNKVYWHYEPYAAFGVGACTFTGAERRTNTNVVQDYIAGWQKREKQADYYCQHAKPKDTLWEAEPLEQKTQLGEAMFMGLRLSEGIDLNVLQDRFKISALELYEKEIKTFRENKMMECFKGRLRLTPYGMKFGNQVFEAFI